jgi:hypothetical protein
MTTHLLHQHIYDKLDHFYVTNKIPHIIFHGASGSGKRTIVHDFLHKIYQNDQKKIKTNVMQVNCAHGKGIKFIREELKFFAKTNVHSNTGILFKTIVLMNADNLTIDAQSALRRCIELFSSNTRFFIIIENKNKLLNPILSRFCEIYVPEHIIDGTIVNLHQLNIKQHLDFTKMENERMVWIEEQMRHFFDPSKPVDHKEMIDMACRFYEEGYSCIDFIRWVEQCDRFSVAEKSNIVLHFDEIKSEYRCEKLLLLCMFDYGGNQGSLPNPPLKEGVIGGITVGGGEELLEEPKKKKIRVNKLRKDPQSISL